MKLIGITGPAGSGKDTCGDWFVKQHGYTRLSFATPIYQALNAMGFGWPKTQDEKELLIPDIGVTWRHCAQTLGTEWGREMISDKLWIVLAKNTIMKNPDKNYVFTDVRFDNEARMIRNLGGTMIHLFGRQSGTGNDSHASEKRLVPVWLDYSVINLDTIDELHRTLTAIAVSIESSQATG